MTIKEALEWAFRDELPKRREDNGSGIAISQGTHPMWQGVAFGGRIDNWTREPGMPIALGDCHPDALRIEQAVLNLNPHLIDITGFAFNFGSTDPVGIDVDVIAAEALRQVVEIVRVRSRLGDRPIVGDVPKSERVRSEIGGNVTIFVKEEQTQTLRGQTYTLERDVPVDKKRCRGGEKPHYPIGAFAKLKYPGRIGWYQDRATYAVWRAALDVLLEQLQGVLTTITLTDTTAPRRPWAGESDAIQVHRDLTPAPRRILGRRPIMPAAPSKPTHGPVRQIFPPPAQAA